ncbi:hypothetical protein CBE01nite_23540 [Clostridium beijerinckii]|uniref:Flagellar protein FlaG n=1 Tax=Clostridium beijerinckii TaxID=1520 RepID=A0AB74VDT2_CLOBE|nr:flagellar protein FlaG [Clostridium beijerinckii]NRZ28844.1 flagellar protein FlaG [Clostridium beijerinckii]NYB95382.1 flagellar protein FlaG [Clostridium beijerinckii]OOM26894.1 flagellar protein FlaG [Clostridium beijerinckii]QUN34515.1 flagellar protein FlaG [Clostridium beijerinckii]SQB00526.1 flaG family protein [Clostridium beijerinckii]
MEVNNIGQSTINTNSYNVNPDVSQYTNANTGVSITQVQKVETQSSEENNAKNQEYSKKDLDDAVKKINNFLKDDKTHAEYTYNEEMKTMMVKVIDENTKEVVLEIPPKKILDMVASMLRQVGLLDKKA